MRLRQVALIARDLTPVVEHLRAVFGLAVGFDTAAERRIWGPELIDRFGISNAVLPVGDTFIEVISPEREGTPAARFLERAGSDTGYMVLVQVDDLAAARERAARLGIREVFSSPLPDIAGVHLDPRDTEGTFLSLDKPERPEEWPWAGPDWRSAVHTELVSELVCARIAVSDPDRVASRWAQLLDRDIRRCRDGRVAIDLDQGRLEFAPRSGEHGRGLCGIELSGTGTEEIFRRARARGLAVEHDGSISLHGISIGIADSAPSQ